MSAHCICIADHSKLIPVIVKEGE